MIQNFKIDAKKKEAIQKVFYKHNKLNYVLWGWILIWVLFNIWWAVHAFDSTSFMSPAWQVNSSDGEELIKNPYTIWSLFAMINVTGPFLYIVLRIVRRRICGKYTTERYNESLLIRNGIIEYGYQNPDHTAHDRVVVLIKGYTATIDKDKITFHGQICQRYYSDYAAGRTETSDEYVEQDWILYDYFEPSLKEWLSTEKEK